MGRLPQEGRQGCGAEGVRLRRRAGHRPRGVDKRAKGYAIERAEEDPRYTKHPATWLAGGCWADEAAGAAPLIDNDGNIIAIAARRRGQKSMTECGAELLHEMGFHQEAEELLVERGYGRA